MYILQLVKLKVSGKNNITIWVYNRSKLGIYFRKSAHKIDQYSFKASHVWTDIINIRNRNTTNSIGMWLTLGEVKLTNGQYLWHLELRVLCWTDTHYPQ